MKEKMTSLRSISLLISYRISLLKGRWPYAASFVLILVTVAALSVMNVSAQCKQWDVSGNWAMEQSNGYKVRMDTIQQNGTSFTGLAHTPYFIESPSILDATVKGNIASGNVYYAEISFKNGGVGIYRGTINAQGIIEGTGYPRIKPKEISTFFSTRAMRCIDKYIAKPAAPAKPPAPAPKAPVQPTFKPITKLRVKLPDPPYILANSAVVRVQTLQPTGLASLFWDGGADHPYAEVWVKVNDADEIKILEKGRGELQYPVSLGSRYTFILTDSGETLSTVQVTVAK